MNKELLSVTIIEGLSNSSIIASKAGNYNFFFLRVNNINT